MQFHLAQPTPSPLSFGPPDSRQNERDSELELSDLEPTAGASEWEADEMNEHLKEA